ncbi:MAG TPA: hypothetical protein VM390_01225, partial [Acidimicrobiales bacterium]|nr:hypothetical protein [Acidimicrobiales bacterium]
RRPAPRRPAPRPAEEPVDEYEEGLARWAGLLSTLGVALVAVVTAQVVASTLQGLALPEQLDANAVRTDLFHRLGFPFGNLGPVTALVLVAGLVLMSLPRLLGLATTGLQERMVSVMLVVAVVLALVIALGSLLAVRNSLHEYTARGVDPPSYVRIGFASFLLGTLGTSAVALFGSLAAISARRRTR